MNYRKKQRLARDISKSLKNGRIHRAARNLLVTTIAASGALGGLVLAPNINPASSTLVEAKQTKNISYGLVKKRVIIRNKKGKKIASKTIKKGKKIKIYGSKTIKGVKYYSLGHGQYIADRYVSMAKTVSITQQCNIFNSKAKRIGKTVLKKGKKVKVYGVKTIKGKQYYNLGNGKYVAVANTTLPNTQPQPNTNNNAQGTNNKPATGNSSLPTTNVPATGGSSSSSGSSSVPTNGGSGNISGGSSVPTNGGSGNTGDGSSVPTNGGSGNTSDGSSTPTGGGSGNTSSGSNSSTGDNTTTEASTAHIASKGILEVVQNTTVGSAADAVTTLPAGATAAWKNPVDTSQVGTQTAYVVVTFKDHSTVEVVITIHVKAKEATTVPGTSEADTSDVTADKAINVARGTTLKPEKARTALKNLPANATAEWKNSIDISQVGPQLALVKVTFHDGSTKDVTVIVNVVSSQADTSNVVAANNPFKVKKGETPAAAKAITALPVGATAAWKTPLNTSKVGQENAIVTVTYDDDSTKDISIVADVKANVTLESKNLTTAFKPGLVAITKGINNLHNDLVAADWESIKNNLLAALTGAHSFRDPWPGLTTGIDTVDPVYNKVVAVAQGLVTKHFNNDLVTFLNGIGSIVNNINPNTIEELDDLYGVFEDYQGTDATMLELKDIITTVRPNLNAIANSLNKLRTDLPEGQYQEVENKLNDFLVKMASLPPKLSTALTSGYNIVDDMYNDAHDILIDLAPARSDLSDILTNIAAINGSLTGEHSNNLVSLTDQIEHYSGTDDTLTKISDLVQLVHPDLTVINNAVAAIKAETADLSSDDVNRVQTSFQDLLTQVKKFPKSVDDDHSFVDWASSNVDVIKYVYNDVVGILKPYTRPTINNQVINVVSGFQDIVQKIDLSKEQEIEAISDALTNGSFDWLNAIDTEQTASNGTNSGHHDAGTDEASQSDVTAKGSLNVVQGADAGIAADALTTLPAGATAEWQDAIDTSQVGPEIAIAIVTYKDRSVKKIPVLVNVTKPQVGPTQASQAIITSKGTLNVVQGTEVGAAANAVTTLPAGATAEWKSPVDTSQVGSQIATVIVAFADHSTKEIQVIIVVTSKPTEATTTNVAAKDTIEVVQGESVGAAQNALTGLPAGAIAEWKTPVDTSRIGMVMAVIKVTFHDGSTKEIQVLVNVKASQTEAAKSNVATGNTIEVVQGSTVDNSKAKLGLTNLPDNAIVSWKTPVDTTQVGPKLYMVMVTFHDGSTKDVQVLVDVKAPQSAAAANSGSIDVKQGDQIGEAAEAIPELPVGAIASWKTPVDTSILGTTTAVVVVNYSDGSTKEITVNVNVKANAASTAQDAVTAFRPGMTQLNQGLASLLSKIQDATVKEDIDDALTEITSIPDGWIGLQGTINGIAPTYGKVIDAAKKLVQLNANADISTVLAGLKSIADNLDQAKLNQLAALNTAFENYKGTDEEILKIKAFAQTSRSSLALIGSSLISFKSHMTEAQYQDMSTKISDILVQLANFPINIEDAYANGNVVPLNAVYNDISGIASDVKTAGPDLISLIAGIKQLPSINSTTLSDLYNEIKSYSGNDATLNKVKDLAELLHDDISNIGDAIDIINTINTKINFSGDNGINQAYQDILQQLNNFPANATKDHSVTAIVLDHVASFEIIYKDTVKILKSLDRTDLNTQINNILIDLNNINDKMTASKKQEVQDIYSAITNHTFTWLNNLDYLNHDATAAAMPGATEAEQSNVASKGTIEIKQGDTVCAAKDAVTTLPAGATAQWKFVVNTNKIGPQIETVVVTFKDGSTKDITVLINITAVGTTEAERSNVTSKGTLEVIQGKQVCEAKDAITALPAGASASWQKPVNTSQVGPQIANVIVSYSDGSTKNVEVLVNVKAPESKPTEASTSNVVSKGTLEVTQNDSVGTAQNAVTALPAGAYAAWKETVDTSQAGSQIAIVVVTFKDGSTRDVDVLINVVPKPTEASTSNITSKGKYQVAQGSQVGAAQDAITALPAGATAAWKDTVDTSQAGSQVATVVVTFKDGSTKEITILIDVTPKTTEAATSTVVAKGVINVRQGAGSTLKPEDAVTALPVGATATWKTPVDTSALGPNLATVTVKFSDNSIKDISVIINVFAANATDADMSNITAKNNLEIKRGKTLAPEDVITMLPAGVSATWKTPVDTSTIGLQTGVVTVTYADNSTKDITVTINVKANQALNAADIVEAFVPGMTGIINGLNSLQSKLDDSEYQSDLASLAAANAELPDTWPASNSIPLMTNKLNPVYAAFIKAAKYLADKQAGADLTTILNGIKTINDSADATKLSELDELCDTFANYSGTNATKLKIKELAQALRPGLDQIGSALISINAHIGSEQYQDIDAKMNDILTKLSSFPKQLSEVMLAGSMGWGTAKFNMVYNDISAILSDLSNANLDFVNLMAGFNTVSQSLGVTQIGDITALSSELGEYNGSDHVLQNARDLVKLLKDDNLDILSAITAINTDMAKIDLSDMKSTYQDLQDQLGKLPKTAGTTNAVKIITSNTPIIKAIYNDIMKIIRTFKNAGVNDQLTRIWNSLQTIKGKMNSDNMKKANDIYTALTNGTFTWLNNI